MKLANRQLRQVFRKLGLEPDEIIDTASGEGVEAENRRLNTLLDWVLAWQAWPDRATLESKGYTLPPLSVCYNPAKDWLIFESWVSGQPVSWRYEEVFGPITPASQLCNEDIEPALQELLDNLWSRRVSVEYEEGLPFRLFYTKLTAYLKDAWFDISDEDTVCHITGCDGYCPGCFQRPWCDAGKMESWPEDERNGHMTVPDCVKPFYSPAPKN